MREVGIVLIIALGIVFIGVVFFAPEAPPNPVNQPNTVVKNKAKTKEVATGKKETATTENNSPVAKVAVDESSPETLKNDEKEPATEIVEQEQDTIVEREKSADEVSDNPFDIPVPTDRRIRVTLRSGTELEGVVKKDLFVEKKQYGVYVKAKDYKEPGAGVRLWYVNQSTGFLFLPYSSIKRIHKLEIVNAKVEERRSILSSQRAAKQNSRRKTTTKPKKTEKTQRTQRSTVNAVRSSGGNTSSRSSSRPKPALKRSSGGGY